MKMQKELCETEEERCDNPERRKQKLHNIYMYINS